MWNLILESYFWEALQLWQDYDPCNLRGEADIECEGISSEVCARTTLLVAYSPEDLCSIAEGMGSVR